MVKDLCIVLVLSHSIPFEQVYLQHFGELDGDSNVTGRAREIGLRRLL